MSDYVPASEDTIGVSANYWLRDKLLEAQARIKQLEKDDSKRLVPERRIKQRRSPPDRRSSQQRYPKNEVFGRRRLHEDRRKS